MRFMVMHKVDAKMEAGERPDDSVIHGMGRYIGQAIKAGTFLDGAGLHPSATRVRLVFEDGARRVVRGPYAGGNELLASFAMITAASMDHAIELGTQLAQAGGDRELEIGPVVEAWDLHGGTRPANAPHRFLLLRKAHAPETDVVPPRARELLDAWKQAGVLQSAGVLAPSAQGARTRVAGGKRTWIDGPFAESKELVAGYSIIDVPSLADARAWAEPYAAILGDNEVDVRVVAG